MGLGLEFGAFGFFKGSPKGFLNEEGISRGGRLEISSC